MLDYFVCNKVSAVDLEWWSAPPGSTPAPVGLLQIIYFDLGRPPLSTADGYDTQLYDSVYNPIIPTGTGPAQEAWELGFNCDLAGCPTGAALQYDGTLYTATSRAQIGLLDPVIAALSEHGINSYQHLAPDEVASRSGSARNLGGVYSPVAATVHPGKLVRGLRRVAIEMGIRIYERTPMLDFTSGERVTVRTPAGSVTAPKLVLAINAWMASRFKQFERTLAVVSSDMIVTEKCPELLQQIGLKDGVSVLDSRIFVYYYRSTADGRLMLGKGGNTFAWRGRIAPVFDQRSPYEADLTRSLHDFFPALRDVPVTASWNGPSDRSVTGFPFFGRLDDAPNVLYGFGYSGNGVGPTYMGGQILSSLLLDLDNEWTRSPLTKGPLGYFPPEPIRYVGSITVRDAIRRKERAEDEDRQPWLVDRLLSKLANAAGKSDKA